MAESEDRKHPDEMEAAEGSAPPEAGVDDAGPVADGAGGGPSDEDGEGHGHEHGEGGPGEPAPEEAGHEALAQALKGSFRVLKVIMVLLIAFYLLKGVFSIDMNETGFKLRFGRIVTPVGQENAAFVVGSWYIQFPWEEKEIVSTAERVMDVGQEFWAEERAGEPPLKSLDVRKHGFLVTGDANIVHLKLRVRYRVGASDSKASAFLFAVDKPEDILRRMAMASTSKVVSSMRVMDVLQRQGLFEKITQDLGHRIDDFEVEAGVPLGVELVAVEAIELGQGNRAPNDPAPKNPTEPVPVRQAFSNAQQAGSRKEALAQEGRTQANAIITQAEAKAREVMGDAEAFRQRLTSLAKADADALAKLLQIHERSPAEAAILRDALYQAALQDVMDNASDSFVMYQMADGNNREIRFMLGRQPPRRRQAGQQEQ
jgi:membrane protease subunit HflK